ncbi:hypothetical protein Agub_g5016 [Astrephomene gubernaculifera]|uniref:Uncharacterized protein n=1 Tax=Astrephomene gubernaculifera TaxID=47775 RepID=A0AAD3DNU6_9CHLO|nr:hypothetical protein Agub_g5016 [Astrephomene gubernaculifera]
MTGSKSGAWTEEEDQLLTKFQAVYGNKWSLVSQHIPGRNGQQCAQRWRHKVNPNIVRDKWTPEEDSILVKLVSELGVGKWASVARHLPGRTDQQCMGRWRRHLDPNIRKDAWTAEEDAELQALYDEYGPSWSCIAKRITNRTPQQCRGRWCILSGCSKSKAAPSTAPETPHFRKNRKGPGAVAAAAATAVRQGNAQGCPSTVSRRGAPTELPAMPASEVAPTPMGTMQPPTVQRVRRCRMPALAVTPEDPDQEDLAEEEAKASVQQRRYSCRLLQVAAAEHLQADAESSGPDKEDTQAQKQGNGGAPTVSAVTKGRLLLGTQVLAFRTRPRSTRRKPCTRVAAVLPPSTSDSPSAECPQQGACVSAAVAAVALLSPPRGTLDLFEIIEEEEAAMLSGLLDDDDEEDRPPLVTAESTGDRGDAAPVRSTSNGGCASASVAYTPDDALLSLSTRITRSGRCYPLTCTNPGGAASQRRRRSPAATTTETEEDHKAAAAAHAAATTTAATSRPTAALENQDTRDLVTSCGALQHGDNGDGAHALPPAPRQQDDAGVQGDVAAHVLALLPPPHAAGVASPVAPLHSVDLGNHVDHVFDNVGSPDPLQVAVPGLDGHLLSSGSTCSSFGIPAHLLSEGQVGGAGEHPADWQQVGSPPTSSLLALLQAGLLQTPTGTPGASPGPSALRAPIVPGMPQVTPGFSHDWSDVPALSWSEWRNCKGGFGVVAQHPATNGQGTPDNTQAAQRAQGTCGVNVTPRRDMFVRPMGQAVGFPQPQLQAHDAIEAMGDSEGQGTTHPSFTSPSISIPGRTRSRRASADEAVLQHWNAGMTETTAAGTTHMAGFAAVSPCRPPMASHGRLLPDFCSPSKKQRMGALETGFGYVGSLPGISFAVQPAQTRQGEEAPAPASTVLGFSVARPAGHAGRLHSGAAGGGESALPMSALLAPPRLELPPTKGNAAMAAGKNMPLLPSVALGALSTLPLMTAPIPLPPAQQLPALAHVPLPPALESALTAAQVEVYRPGNAPTPAHPPPARGSGAGAMQDVAREGGGTGVVRPAPLAGPLGGHNPLGLLPLLALPKLPVGAPQQRAMSSFFPVLTLNDLRDGKANAGANKP